VIVAGPRGDKGVGIRYAQRQQSDLEKMKTQIDHLVVMTSSLNEGVQWCEDTLGITPGPGGEHTLYGTHNRLFKVASPANPMAYVEFIAIDPDTGLLTAVSDPRKSGRPRGLV
jgi:hypothetical protein